MTTVALWIGKHVKLRIRFTGNSWVEGALCLYTNPACTDRARSLIGKCTHIQIYSMQTAKAQWLCQTVSSQQWKTGNNRSCALTAGSTEDYSLEAVKAELLHYAADTQ